MFFDMRCVFVAYVNLLRFDKVQVGLTKNCFGDVSLHLTLEANVEPLA